ncbi:MAG: hypothetical protein JW991_02345 [Candidatus Pacebacteria bacterium]|nr:hypothetical protein [Candidatus Paceibacterota bacterium]
MNQKKLLILALLILSPIILAVGRCAFKETSRPPASSPAPEATGNNTNPTKYLNSQFGFEFLYPPNWQITSSGPNEEQQKLNRGETISGTNPPSLETITFSDSGLKELFNLVIFPAGETGISPAEFEEHLSLGSACDTRWIKSINQEPTLTLRNGVLILSAQVTLGGAKEGELAGCYYFKNLKDHLITFNIAGLKEKSDFLEIFNLIGNQILPTLKMSR